MFFNPSINISHFIYPKAYKILNSFQNFSHIIRVKMEKEFKELGLTHYESKALSLLIQKSLTLKKLSDKAEIPFGKVYSVVKSLKEKNLVKENNSRPKLVYVDDASEVVSKLINHKKEKENKLYEKARE